MNIVGFLKNSFIDYPKNIACVVFTPGCNMNCWYCHNRAIITMTEGTINQEEVFEFLKQRKQFIDAVVISGGEPTMQPNLPEFVTKVKSLGYKVKLDTNGTNLAMVKQLVENELVNYVAMDIKAPWSSYQKITTVPSIEEMKQTAQYLMNCGIDYEFRTTFVPNLTPDDIKQIVRSIEGAKRYSLQAYIKPDFITNSNLVSHKAEIFYELQQWGKELVGEFLVKNL